MRPTPRILAAQVLKRAALGIVLAAMVAGSTGVGCDSAARAAFRDAAVSPIGEGVRTAMNGVLDGVIAAIDNANSNSTSN